MLTIVTLAILVTLLVIVLMQLFKKRPPAPAGPAEDLANLKVTDARAGDVLSVAGAGDDLKDLDFPVDRVTRYEAGSRRWRELAGSYRERRVALRVGGDDEVEVSLHSDPRKLALEDLGLSEDDLAQLDERQNTADNFQFDDKWWLYRLSREVRISRDDQPPSGCYYWEFQEQGGKGLLGIRKMEGEPFAVTLYTSIPASDVTVYRGTGA